MRHLSPTLFRLFSLATVTWIYSTCGQAAALGEDWIIDSDQQWNAAAADVNGATISTGQLAPTGTAATFRSNVRPLPEQKKLHRIVIEQSPVWQNWQPVKNVGPANLGDAPVLLCIEPDNYWMFGRYRQPGKRRGKRPAKAGKNKAGKAGKQQARGKQTSKQPRKQGPAVAKHQPEPAKLDGFDVPLLTTRYENQFDAPGGLQPKLGGYHAWQSRDMVNWVHHGPVTEDFSRWVTTAEHVGGKTYIYYDYPNDQDPHVYVDADLTDGKPGENKGMVLADPSHGSDCAMIRDLQGQFHVIFEDWSPINARQNSWDSPLAGHAVSRDGVHDFRFKKPVIDHRTTPTGRMAEYIHPHWDKHPKWDSSVGKYEVHEPAQNAYGDWASVAIGGRYYLFGDFDPAKEGHMSVGWFTSETIDGPFTWCDQIGQGHPDPDIGFAEGKFYLVTQQATDFVSPGPWVESVEVRVGIDADGDNSIDQWTEWQRVREQYSQRAGFAKQIDRQPAAVDLSSLPAAHAVQFELRITDSTDNKSKPIIDRVHVQMK